MNKHRSNDLNAALISLGADTKLEVVLSEVEKASSPTKPKCDDQPHLSRSSGSESVSNRVISIIRIYFSVSIYFRLGSESR